MGRGTYSFCPRESMPMPVIESKDPIIEKPIDTPTMLPQDAMTWQQEQKFGHLKPNGRRNNQKWRPFDQAAIDDTSGNANAWTAQKAAILPQGHLHNNNTPTPSSHHANKLAPTETSTPTSTYTHKDSIKKPASAHKPKKRSKDGNMTTLPKSAYIPPNRRKLGSANGTKVDATLDNDAAHGTPAGSEKSKIQPLTQLHSSPENAKLPPSSPLSPPTTAPEQEKLKVEKSKPVSPAPARQDNGEWAGWDQPKPDSPHPTRKNNNPRWPRGPKAAPKKTVWLKSRDMKYIPGNTDSDGGVSFKSNSNGDPNYDVKKLLDWNGDWLPPPEQWSARKGYTNRHFGQEIEQWIDGHSEECCQGIVLQSNAYRGRQTTNADGEIEHVLVDDICKEIVPRYWMTATVEGKSLGEFWKEFPDRSPEALSDIDIMEDAPWWNRYEDLRSYFIDGLVVPDAVADLEDPDNCVNPCGFAPAEQKVQEMFARAEKRKRKLIARRTQPLPEPKVLLPPVEDKRIRPAANVYFRPVQPADVRGIAEIYNHYVENSIYANEFDGRTEVQIRDRINDITTQGLPYLVAVAKSNQMKQKGYISEKIVGYINLDDYCDQSSMYRYTFEMELFIHPGYTHKSIAKCLLDRLLEMSNTGYNARGGYEYVNGYEYLKSGPARVIKTILLNVHHKHGEDMKWASEYLSAFKFVRAGHISHVGFKHDQVVDISIFQHHTTEPINANGIPTVPLERN